MTTIDTGKIADLIMEDCQFTEDINPMEAAERIAAWLMADAEVEFGMGFAKEPGKEPWRVARMSPSDAEAFARLDSRHRAVVRRRSVVLGTEWEVVPDDEE